MKLPSNKPYLLRAVYEWIVDNNATPHVALFAENPDVLVPEQFVEDGKIVLNISPTAAEGLLIDNNSLSFSARFGGKPFNVYAPIGAVLALYASENGEGLSFDLEPSDETPPEDPPPAVIGSVDTGVKKPSSLAKSKISKRPSLKVVK
ncbi:MAG: ClpXP protease specificity-enhancing factor [Cocleimonas sp.]